MIVKRADILKAALDWRKENVELSYSRQWEPDRRRGMAPWVKRVTMVKPLKTGYAFDGPFIEATDEIPGNDAVFLTCFTMGSRKHQCRYFDVVLLQDEELTATGIHTDDRYGGNRYWALDIRETIRALVKGEELPPDAPKVQDCTLALIVHQEQSGGDLSIALARQTADTYLDAQGMTGWRYQEAERAYCDTVKVYYSRQS